MGDSPQVGAIHADDLRCVGHGDQIIRPAGLEGLRVVLRSGGRAGSSDELLAATRVPAEQDAAEVFAVNGGAEVVSTGL